MWLPAYHGAAPVHSGFYCTQALGIMLEDGMQALYRYARGTQRNPEPPSRWIRMAGYRWVIAFVVWSTAELVLSVAKDHDTGTKV